MRTSTVRSGLGTIIAGSVVIMVATVGHDWLGRILSLSYENEMRVVVGGLFWGGMLGGLGAVITVFGLFRSPGGRHARIFPLLVLLVATLLLYLVLVYSTFEHPREPRPRPGETITI